MPKNPNYNVFTKVLLLRYNHNHRTHMYHCPLKVNVYQLFLVTSGGIKV